MISNLKSIYQDFSKFQNNLKKVIKKYKKNFLYSYINAANLLEALQIMSISVFQQQFDNKSMENTKDQQNSYQKVILYCLKIYLQIYINFVAKFSSELRKLCYILCQSGPKEKTEYSSKSNSKTLKNKKLTLIKHLLHLKDSETPKSMVSLCNFSKKLTNNSPNDQNRIPSIFRSNKKRRILTILARLSKLKQKNQFIKIDWQKWVEEDEQQEEGQKGLGGIDPSQMQNFDLGNMGEFGGEDDQHNYDHQNCKDHDHEGNLDNLEQD